MCSGIETVYDTVRQADDRDIDVLGARQFCNSQEYVSGRDYHISTVGLEGIGFHALLHAHPFEFIMQFPQ